jgi:hypothetical protein
MTAMTTQISTLKLPGSRVAASLDQGVGATRRRWPGSRAGLCRGAARPAQAGPISPAPTSIATAQPSGCAWSRRTAMSSSAGAFSSAWSLCGCLTRFRSCLRVTGRSTRHDPLPPSTRANRARMEPLPAQSIMPPKAVRLTVPSLFGFLAAVTKLGDPRQARGSAGGAGCGAPPLGGVETGQAAGSCAGGGLPSLGGIRVTW